MSPLWRSRSAAADCGSMRSYSVPSSQTRRNLELLERESRERRGCEQAHEWLLPARGRVSSGSRRGESGETAGLLLRCNGQAGRRDGHSCSCHRHSRVPLCNSSRRSNRHPSNGECTHIIFACCSAVIANACIFILYESSTYSYCTRHPAHGKNKSTSRGKIQY